MFMDVRRGSGDCGGGVPGGGVIIGGDQDFIEVQLEELDNRHCLQLDEASDDDDDYD